MHNSRQLFVSFVITVCVAHVSAVSVASDNTETTPRSAKSRKHRTPFIVPISPPQFGSTPSLPEKLSVEAQYTRSVWQVADNADFEAPVTLQQQMVALPSPTDVALVENQWASQVQSELEIDVAVVEQSPSDTQSKVVGINRPNVTALSERITVHNLNVAAMEDQLRANDSWTLEEIESAYEQLTSIAENRRIWSMYFDLLEPRKQRRIGFPTTLTKCEELLRQRIFETQVTLEINQFAVTKLNREVASSRLKELSRLLAE